MAKSPDAVARGPPCQGPFPGTLTRSNTAYILRAPVWVPSWEEIPMRTLALTILTTGIVLTTGPAQAQRYDPAYPVCLNVVSRGMTPYYRCSYTTMEQCRASANGQMCSLNPYYADAATPVKPNNQRYRQAKSRSYAPPGPPTRYRAAPCTLYNEPYFGACQGYAPGEEQQFFDSLRRYM